MSKILLGIFLSITLLACDTVEGMRDLVDTQVQLRGIMQEELGIETLVGFNYDGETLIDVTFSMNAGEVADKSVTELERVARSAVKRTFDSKPRAIYIQLVTTAE